MSATEKKTPKERETEIKEKAKRYFFDETKKETKTISEIFKASTEKQKVWVDEPLGCFVEIGHISMLDMTELMQIEDKNLQGLEMLYRLLLSANPKTTKDEVFGLPTDVATVMINAILKEGMGFRKAMNSPKVQQDS